MLTGPSEPGPRHLAQPCVTATGHTWAVNLDEIWLPTETGTTLHRLEAQHDDYYGSAPCRSGGHHVGVGGYVPACGPLDPLTRPRDIIAPIATAAAKWDPLIDALDAMQRCSEEPDRYEQLGDWLLNWVDVYERRLFVPDHDGYMRRLARLGGDPLAEPLARLGASGISGRCRRCLTP